MKFYYNKILIISDNAILCERFITLCEILGVSLENFDFGKSPQGEFTIKNLPKPKVLRVITVKEQVNELIDEFDLIISMHCKQLFPKELVTAVKCINVHPGFNPFNRGWFPQVFSILNKKPFGATLHEIDELLDHGPIIAQELIHADSSDTSKSLYNKVIDAEIRLLQNFLLPILKNNYLARLPSGEGNVNYKSDFNKLKALDLAKKQTIGETIDLLRALSHAPYRNAFFVDPITSEKVYVNISLVKENEL